MERRPQRLACGAGSRARSVIVVAGNRSRMCCCWAVITFAVAWLIGSRRPCRWRFVVVVDEHRRSVRIMGKAVPWPPQDLIGPPAGVGEQLDCAADLRSRWCLFQQREMLA